VKTEIYWPTGQMDFKIFFLPCLEFKFIALIQSVHIILIDPGNKFKASRNDVALLGNGKTHY